MPRRSPRARRKPGGAKLPQAPRVRSAPGRARPAAARSKHAAKGARTRVSAPAAKKTKPARPRAGGRATRRFVAPDPVRVRAVIEQLQELYPDARCALDFRTPLELLVATILSAQCTDERVNKVTPALFATYPDAAAFAAADPAALEKAIHSTGFFRNKAKSIREASADIVAKHGGQVPRTLEDLTALRGVGRKTANVVLGNAYGVPGVVVDTHVTRLSHRLGLTNETDPVKIEFALMPLVPRELWTLFSHWLILHGRAVCNARKPLCSQCPLAPHCPRLGVTASA
jgi:endonuclease-3